ncbi:unnamed protein product [Candidula unifasciata]|uniref:C2H2-type domain-containing protein n=1 Tax=Candidula unifasciata TaxID=100452 RepID=A0A8S3YRD2_9EUPU|nr:unnamed protein product [Candidula unifasciata]
MTMHQDSSKSLECCGISFQNKAALRDHNSIFHRGGYRCQICSRNFCRKALLRRHLTVHSGQKDFFCEICGYATSHKSNLERHQKVHTKKEPTTEVLRKRSTATENLQLGTASFLSRAILNSQAQSMCYQVPGVTSALPSYETANKSFIIDGALNQKSQFAAFTVESAENYMNKLQILSSLKNSLHDNIHVNSYTKNNYDCDDKNINVKREDEEGPVPSIHINTY